MDLNVLKTRATMARNSLQQTLNKPLTPATPQPPPAQPQAQGQPAPWLSKLDFTRMRPSLATQGATAPPAPMSIRASNSKGTLAMMQRLLQQAQSKSEW